MLCLPSSKVRRATTLLIRSLDLSANTAVHAGQRPPEEMLDIPLVSGGGATPLFLAVPEGCSTKFVVRDAMERD